MSASNVGFVVDGAVCKERSRQKGGIVSNVQKKGIPVDALEARYEQVLARWEAVGQERSDVAADLLRVQTALKLVGRRRIASSDCALDQTATDVALLRQAFCSALHSHHCATVVLERTREAFRSAQERLDCIALMEMQRRTRDD